MTFPSRWRLGHGDGNLLFVPGIIGIFYFIEGLYGAKHLGSFFLLFVVQAVLLVASAWALGAPAVTPTQSEATRQRGDTDVRLSL